MDELNSLLTSSKVFRKASFQPSEVTLSRELTYEGYFDGCSLGNPGAGGAGYLLKSEARTKRLISRSLYIGNRTSNQAEIVALILLLGDCYCNGV